MIGLDIETMALDPSEGDLRLVQLGFPGGKAQVFDPCRSSPRRSCAR